MDLLSLEKRTLSAVASSPSTQIQVLMEFKEKESLSKTMEKACWF
jgi:hypothetical protein